MGTVSSAHSASLSTNVWVTGAAGKKLVLKDAECAELTVPIGTFIRVKLFDTKRDRYLLESSDGGCGWVPAANIDKTLKELPWAG